MRYLLTLLLASLLVPVAAQMPDSSTATTATPLFQSELNAKKYNLARRFGDTGVAIGVLYDELARQPENVDLMDSLATLYFQNRAFNQALGMARFVLANRPQDNRMLELSAICLQNLGSIKDALASYENLYLRTQNLSHLYQVAVLQYQLTRVAECAATVNRLLQDPKNTEVRVFVPVNQQQGQNILVKAASLNILGVLQRDQGQLPAAKKSFQQALEIEAEFLLAKNNLEQVNKQLEGK